MIKRKLAKCFIIYNLDEFKTSLLNYEKEIKNKRPLKFIRYYKFEVSLEIKVSNRCKKSSCVIRLIK